MCQVKTSDVFEGRKPPEKIDFSASVRSRPPAATGNEGVLSFWTVANQLRWAVPVLAAARRQRASVRHTDARLAYSNTMLPSSASGNRREWGDWI